MAEKGGGGYSCNRHWDCGSLLGVSAIAVRQNGLGGEGAGQRVANRLLRR